MQQRRYYGNVSPDGLAEYLGQYFGAQPQIQSQVLGQGDSWIVQITAGPGRGPAGRGGMAGPAPWGARAGAGRRSEAMTTSVGLQRLAGDALLVTVAGPGAISPRLAGYLVMLGVISLVAWPLAIFVPIWVAAAVWGGRAQRTAIWDQIGIYTLSRGARPGRRVNRADLAGGHAGAADAQPFAQPLPLALLPSGADAETRKLPVPS